MSPPPEPKDPLLVLINPEFTEFEIAVATTLLSRRFTLQYVAPTLAPVRSEGGLQVLPDLTLEHVVPRQYAALIVSAAHDMQSALENAAILDLIWAMDQAGKIVAAICGAPMLLAKAGVLRDRLYTVSLYRRFRDFLGCFNEATFRNQPLIETENLEVLPIVKTTICPNISGSSNYFLDGAVETSLQPHHRLDQVT